MGLWEDLSEGIDFMVGQEMGLQYKNSVFCSLFLVMYHGVPRKRDEFLSEVQIWSEYALFPDSSMPSHW